MTDNYLTDPHADRAKDDDLPDAVLDRVAALILGAPIPAPSQSAAERGAA